MVVHAAFLRHIVSVFVNIYMHFFAGECPIFNQVQSSFGEYWFYDLCIGGHAAFVVPTYK